MALTPTLRMLRGLRDLSLSYTQMGPAAVAALAHALAALTALTHVRLQGSTSGGALRRLEDRETLVRALQGAPMLWALNYW